MVGIDRGASALSALQFLSGLQSQLHTYEKQMATGLRVAGPSDDPIAWAASTRASSDARSLSAAQSSLTAASSVTGVASSALTRVLSILNLMKTDVASASESSANVASAQSDIAAQQQALISTISTAAYDGVNLLDGSTVNPSFVTSFARSSSGHISYASTVVSTADTILTTATSPGGLLGAATGASSASARPAPPMRSAAPRPHQRARLRGHLVHHLDRLRFADVEPQRRHRQCRPPAPPGSAPRNRP